jgi:cytochrome P450
MVLMDAGAETTASFVHNIVLAFLSYPECLKHAQKEIDLVIGSSRLPTMEDYDKLPYLKAFVEEV